AIPTLTLSDGLTTVIVPNVSFYSGPVGADWLVSVVGITKPVFGSATSPEMELSLLSAASSVAGTLTVEFSDDFFGPTSGSITSSTGGTADNGTVAYSTFADPGNALFAET